MIRYKVFLENPNRRSIQKAVEALEQGKLIVYPTDTVYGIGCSIYQKNAIELIYQIKKKSKFDPMSLICSSITEASQYARISNFAFRILKRCLPGPYTFILPATREIPRLMLSRRKEVGIRIPKSNVCMALLEALGHPIINTSVNQSSDELLNDPREIATRYNGWVDVLLDAGSLPDAQESTVISLMNDEIVILREGKGEVEKVLL